jgi:hypothetical protein
MENVNLLKEHTDTVLRECVGDIIFSERRPAGSPWRRFLEPSAPVGARDNPLKFELALRGRFTSPHSRPNGGVFHEIFVFQNTRRLRLTSDVKSADFVSDEFLKFARRRLVIGPAGHRVGHVLIIQPAASV